MTHGRKWRIGVETTTKSDHIARSARQAADIAVEWLIGAHAAMSLTPEISSAGWPRFGERFKWPKGSPHRWMNVGAQVDVPLSNAASKRLFLMGLLSFPAR